MNIALLILRNLCILKTHCWRHKKNIMLILYGFFLYCECYSIQELFCKYNSQKLKTSNETSKSTIYSNLRLFTIRET